ncbi:unnamed protein product, partial [Closterium sp. Naga37s-1]
SFELGEEEEAIDMDAPFEDEFKEQVGRSKAEIAVMGKEWVEEAVVRAMRVAIREQVVNIMILVLQHIRSAALRSAALPQFTDRVADPNSTLSPAADPNSTLSPAADPNSTLSPAADPNSTLSPAADPNSTLSPAAASPAKNTGSPKQASASVATAQMACERGDRTNGLRAWRPRPCQTYI